MYAHLTETIEPDYTTFRRMRRNRKCASIRELLQEVQLEPRHLIAPLFVLPGRNQLEEVSTLPGVFRMSCDLLVKECAMLWQLGIRSVMLFPVIPTQKKDAFGSYALDLSNPLFKAIEQLKEAVPELLVMVDVALDPYTDHGHDGVLDDKGDVANDKTVDTLAQLALCVAQYGADVIAPSDMMDGRVQIIRHNLDEYNYPNVNILAYTAKFASALYSPFRSVVGSTLRSGDKKTYQLPITNTREALLEAKTDEEEGADFLLVKPALSYLDILCKIKEQAHIPVGAYHVSGEYAMLQAAAKMGLLDFEKTLFESLLCIRRAGADFILTYGAKEAAKSYSKII